MKIDFLSTSAAAKPPGKPVLAEIAEGTRRISVCLPSAALRVPTAN